MRAQNSNTSNGMNSSPINKSLNRSTILNRYLGHVLRRPPTRILKEAWYWKLAESEKRKRGHPKETNQ